MVFGILLIAIAVIVFILMLLTTGNYADLHFGSLGSLHLSVFVVFLIGMATLLVFVLGLEIARRGAGRGLQRRRDRRELKRSNKELRKERDEALANQEEHGDGDVAGR